MSPPKNQLNSGTTPDGPQSLVDTERSAATQPIRPRLDNRTENRDAPDCHAGLIATSKRLMLSAPGFNLARPRRDLSLSHPSQPVSVANQIGESLNRGIESVSTDFNR
jgi:hypothetical protein